MSVKEKPITINDITFNSFEEFYNYMATHRPPKQEVIHSLEEDLRAFEQKYHMSTEEFVNTIVGTPAEDEFDFMVWAGYYRSYRRLTNGKENESGR